MTPAPFKDVSGHQRFWILTHQGSFTEQPNAAICGLFEIFGIISVNYNIVFNSHVCVLNGGCGEGGIKLKQPLLFYLKQFVLIITDDKFLGFLLF